MPLMASADQLLYRQMSDEDTYYFVGITSRIWLERLGGHISETCPGNDVNVRFQPFTVVQIA
jgi:hypothetical protein